MPHRRVRFPVAKQFFDERTGKGNPEQTRLIVRTVNGLLEGKLNSVYELVLAVDAESTEFSDPRITPDTIATLIPQSASAAAALAVLYQVASKGKITFTHDSKPDTDRSFGIALLG